MLFTRLPLRSPQTGWQQQHSPTHAPRGLLQRGILPLVTGGTRYLSWLIANDSPWNLCTMLCKRFTQTCFKMSWEHNQKYSCNKTLLCCMPFSDKWWSKVLVAYRSFCHHGGFCLLVCLKSKTTSSAFKSVPLPLLPHCKCKMNCIAQDLTRLKTIITHVYEEETVNYTKWLQIEPDSSLDTSREGGDTFKPYALRCWKLLSAG